MPPSYRFLITWTLAPWFALLFAVGEGWHFVPGNGHWVDLPNGRGLIVGGAARFDVSRVPDAGPAVTASRPEDLPHRDAGSCLICRLVGQAKLPRVEFDGPSWKPFAQPVAELARPVFGTHISTPFHARAPPLF